MTSFTHVRSLGRAMGRFADGGDHAVVVGHVVDLDHAPESHAEPLLFYAGSYRRIGQAPLVPAVPEPTDVQGL